MHPLSKTKLHPALVASPTSLRKILTVPHHDLHSLTQLVVFCQYQLRAKTRVNFSI